MGSDWADIQAQTILEEKLAFMVKCDGCECHSDATFDHGAADVIAMALRAERLRWAAFADEHGAPRKVLGTLPVTKDGAIVGHYCQVWVPGQGQIRCIELTLESTSPGHYEPSLPHVAWGGPAYDAELVSNCYSTEAAAAASKAEGAEAPRL